MALDACNPVLLEIDESCGCTITKADLIALTPEELDARDWEESGIERVYAKAKEGRLAGVQEKAFIDLFISRLRPKKRGNLGESGGQSLIAPYFLEPNEVVINSNYFVIETGAANQGGATNTWEITVTNHEGEWATNIPALERYFIPGQYIAVRLQDDTGVGRTVNAKIVSATNADAGGTYKADVVIEGNITATAFDLLSAANKAWRQPTHGVVQLLSNSVLDRESWCYNKPSNMNWQWRDYWWQTIRNTHCVNDEYLKALAAPLTSDYFKKFRMLPLAKQRKQHMHLEERMLINTLLWGDIIDENQTIETYTSLPPIADVGDADGTSCVYEYKSNLVGVVPQLTKCNRVVDFSGAALDLDEILVDLKSLARYRGQATGQNVVRIDAWTDQATLAALRYKYITYIKAKYGIDNLNVYYKPAQKIEYSLTGRVLWNYDLFMFLDEGIELAIMSDFAFDDYLAAFPTTGDHTADKSAGRFFMVLDWSDIDVPMAGSRSVTRQTNIADNIYNCVIQPNVTRYQLESMTLSLQVHDPNRHMIYTNFTANCPTLTAEVCTEYSS